MKEGTIKFLISTFVLLLAFSVVVTPFLSVEKVNAQEDGSWTTLAPLPESSHTIGVAVVDGKIYVISWSTCEKYDPETNNWTTIASVPVYSGAGSSVVALGNKIYIIGGNPTQVYDPVIDSWQNRTGIPYARSSMRANVVDDKIYLIGGRLTHTGLYIVVTSNRNDVYDPETDTWSQMAPIPLSVMGYASAVFNNKIYIISGGNESGPDYLPTNLVQIFDPATNQWTNGLQIPTSVCYARACVTTGTSAPKRIYVIGGTTGYYDRWATYNTVNLTQIYNPETDAWTTGTPMPTSRCSVQLAVVNDEIYAIGGVKDEKQLVANEKYTPSGYIPEFPSWTILPLVLTITLFSIIIKRKIKRD